MRDRLARSLRVRLTLALSAVLVVSGGALVTAVYLAADHAVFEAAEPDIQDIEALMEEVAGEPELCGSGPEEGCPWEGTSPGEVSEIWVITEQTSQRMAHDTVRALAGRAALIALVFTALAITVVWWVLRRSLRRLEDATRTVRRIDGEHTELRLRIDGPRDEVRELGETVDGVLDDLAEALEAQRRFVANASHELRTPLATARTALDIPLAQDRVPPELLPAVRAALTANERAAELLDALLVLARTGTDGDLAERADHVDLAPVLREAADAAAGHRVVHTDLRPAVVLGDPTMLHQVVTNLVRNADEHNLPGGEVWLSCGQRDDRVVLEVANDGHPIAPEAVPLLREPFHRGDRSRLTRGEGAGMGLGLAIVDTIVGRHGGRLALEPRPAGGLAVRVELPASAGLPPVSSAEQATPPPPGGPARWR